MSKELHPRKPLLRDVGKLRIPARTDESPALSVIDTHMERRERLLSSSIRLVPMAALGFIVYAALTTALAAIEKTWLSHIAIGYQSGIEAYGLFSILFVGLIPILTASILVITFKPSSDYVLGLAPDPTSYVSAPFAGFFIGMFIWCVAQLISTFDIPFDAFLATPAIWEHGMHYFGRTAFASLMVLLVAVLLPAVSIELLGRGLLQPALMTCGSKLFTGLVISALFALTFFDVNGLIILTIWGIVSFWIRFKTDSLIASSLGTASFAAAMLFSRTIFTAIDEQLFHMPLIELSKLRVYLLMCSFILFVLLLIPTAIINETGKRVTGEEERVLDSWTMRERNGAEKRMSQASSTARRALQVTALLCTAIVAVLVFLT